VSLVELERLLQWSAEREQRARELQESVPNAAFYFGLTGCRFDDPESEIVEKGAVLRRVVNPPGLVHVTRAADPSESDYLAVSRYSLAITAEIAVGVDSLETIDEELALDLAWHAVALLKLGGAWSLSCPSSATVSWDTVSAVATPSVRFRVLDDVPRQIAADIDGPRTISAHEVAWVRGNYLEALKLRGTRVSRRFGLALSLSYTWNHTTDLRIAIASVWAGLEALFGDQRDRRVTDALASRISAWTPSASGTDVRRLYKQRCEAVHGRWLSEKTLLGELRESVELLRESLVRCIERRAVPLPDWN
jgi:hypothetical protein